VTETSQDVQHVIDGLIDSAWGFSAVVTSVEIGLLDALETSCSAAECAAAAGINGDLARGLLDVLVSLSLANRDGGRYTATPGLREFLRASESEDILAWLRSGHFQSRQMVDAARHGELRPGWIHTDPDVLQAQGRTGRTSVHALASQLFPRLPGLQDRLQSPGCAFLDVGIGVGIIAIEMCRIYPHLRVTGLEPGAVQAEEARRNIADAGLEDRIEVRPQRLEELDDHDVFDLAYLPQMFMPADVARDGLPRVRDALRPGGWILVAAVSAPGNDLHAATSRLINIMWGGSSLTADDIAQLTRDAGFEWVQIGGAPGSLLKGVVGRRPDGT